jgi:hypothetical protein
MLRRVALLRAYVSVERSASIIRVTRIGELGMSPYLTTDSCHPDEGDVKFLRNFGFYKSRTV